MQLLQVMAKRQEQKDSRKEQIAMEIGTLCAQLVRLEVVKNFKEIDDALKSAELISPNSTDLSKSYSREESMSLEKREKILNFIRQTWPVYRAIFWAVSTDIDVWSEPAFYFLKQAGSESIAVKAKGLFRAKPDIVCRGKALFHQDGIVEIETDNPVGRYKSNIIGCFRRLHFEEAPMVGIIGGHYLAVSGSAQANHPITVRPVILFPEYYFPAMQTKFEDCLKQIKDDKDWWRMGNETWFKLIDELEQAYQKSVAF